MSVASEPDNAVAALSALRALCEFGAPEYDNAAVCDRAGADREVADRLWRALGFADVPDGELAFTEDDARALQLATEGLGDLAPPAREAALQLCIQEARVVSAHLAGLAEIELDALGAMVPLGFRTRIVGEAMEHGIGSSDLGWLILYCVRRQLLGAIERRAIGAHAGEDTAVLSVGFVDLVDFTGLSDRLSMPALGRLLAAFEGAAFDAVTEAGGRVVKLIGDEVMYVCPKPGAAVHAALDILDRVGELGLPAARAGISSGAVLRQAGDYFGRAVNLASRITSSGVEDMVWIDDQTARVLSGDITLEIGGAETRDLKGLGPTPLFSVRRHGSAAGP